MSTQKSMFSTLHVWFVYRKEFNRKTRQKIQLVEVYEGDEGPIIFVECVTFPPHPLEKDVIGVAKQAYLLRKSRPLGDEYMTEFGAVSYLFER